jgi:hypothetical protein
LLAGPGDATGIFAGHVPGKVWEYLATNLPILCVGAPESDAAQLLNEQPGTYVINAGDEAAAMGALQAAQLSRPVRDADAYGRRTRASALAGVLDRVCS